jgi:hypothetical protein
MTPTPKELLIEQAASAYRERNTWGRILPSPVWQDLAPEDRDEVFACQSESRLIERALHHDGLSSTVQAVLERLK